jgi:hypothetical protein
MINLIPLFIKGIWMFLHRTHGNLIQGIAAELQAVDKEPKRKVQLRVIRRMRVAYLP